eukprot:CAMPEP_0201679900 /NCGR_PEP_ID=MMETSP0494-20130426/49552_1 /ASSEMBLY_ACC=CAM_ASM_000839 /TAXON_ID=420259 /ORGANISM="Thalassiosira gravida, Strain GMp14c1" /LENGTH=295 /DNA_ID=CAMNT_0048163525 /DNA_START=206 /DNA_END=1090 /DNA_ORIENTATION=-
MEIFPDLTFISTKRGDEDARALSWIPRQYTGKNSSNWQERADVNSADIDLSNGQDNVPYVRAIFGFVIALMLYFCFLSYIWGIHSDASKREFDRNIIKKRVLPHGQSQRSRSEDKDCDTNDGETSTNICCYLRLSSRCCCHRKQKQAIAPAPNSAGEILEAYRHRMCAQCSSVRSVNIQNGTENEQTITDGDDELVLAEEGSHTNNSEMLCSICLDPFRVGELVAWSNMGHCRHVFHYDCILPWAVLGNICCPVCRELFWSRKIMERCSMCHSSGTSKKNSEINQSVFCVQHGLV